VPWLVPRLGPVRASLVIAAAWAAWHIPAFFYLPTYEHLGPGALVGFAFGILAGAFLMTWLVQTAGGGTLPAIVWHGLFNFATASAMSAGVPAAVVSTGVMLMGFTALAAFAIRPRQRPAPAPRHA
jgi:CAAX protease family protein